MNLNSSSLKPLFIQVAEWVEDEILKGNILEGDKIFSQVEFSKVFNVNPLTAGKGMSTLESRGILEKKRGLGMFVSTNARSIIDEYRRNEALITLTDELIDESTKLGMDKTALIEFISNRIEIKNKSNE